MLYYNIVVSISILAMRSSHLQDKHNSQQKKIVYKIQSYQSKLQQYTRIKCGRKISQIYT